MSLGECVLALHPNLFCQAFRKMAPVLSRLRPSPLPDEVWRMVALLLTPRELKNLVVSCRACHFAGAPVLYRSVEAWLDPLNYDRLPFRTDNRPIEFLLTIINSTLPGRAPHLTSRCYAAHLVTFCYGSWSMACDFRALPLLGEALRHTYRLHHLRLDVSSQSVPMLLDIFRRLSIIITPTTMLPGSGAVDRRPLPCLQSVRTSRLAIADALMQYRAIQTVVVDLGFKWEVLAKFLRAEAPWTLTHLRQLSLYVSGFSDNHGVLEGMLIAFPRLQHLAVRVNAVRAPAFMKNALRVLMDLPGLGHDLRTLSVNHAHTCVVDGTVLPELGCMLVVAGNKRPALREVVMGWSLWSRKTIFDEWKFAEDTKKVRMGHWLWLRHRNEGEWARFGDAVRAYYHRYG